MSMSASPVRYDRWKAPAEDGRVLIWPNASDLIADTIENHRRLAGTDSAPIQNVPFSEVRRQMRRWLGHDDGQMLVATEHQTELHHPGVWAKNALIDAVASKTGGRAFHFAVDTDEPKHLVVRWPGGAEALTDDASTRPLEWSGLMAPPTPAHLKHIEDEFAQAAAKWSFQPLVPGFLASMRRLSLGGANLSATLTEALHQFDWDLGLRYDAMLVSPICFSEPYLLFVHHVLARAGEFAGDYNAALDQFRRENKIRTPGRPIANLKISADSCEVPFWLDELSTGARTRASVIRQGDRWSLRAHAGEPFEFDQAIDGWTAASHLLNWLRRNSLRLSPRALTLTAVLRLLVADQFVHGIGGGLYDQVLDALIVRHIGIEPPRFSVTTATLFFPEAVGQPRVCLPCMVQEGRRLKHGILGPKKMQLVERISALPRRSTQRSKLFYQMHDELSSAWALPQVRSWEERFRDAEARAQEEKVLFDRELFYAIQSRERLTALIDRYRQEVGPLTPSPSGRGLG